MQIKLNNVEHIFSKNTPWEFKALNGVSITINQGEYIGVIGQTGSGKTTFIQHLNALLNPTEGEVSWIFEHEPNANKEILLKLPIYKKRFFSFLYPKTKKLKKSFKFKASKLIRNKIGVVFQFAEYQLFKQTVLEDIIFAPVAFGMNKELAKEKAKTYIKLVGLSEDYLKRSPFDLSGGQKRRVALAGILALEPQVLVVDEPTAGLDPVGVVEILDILTKLNQQGTTVVNVTHDLDHVLERAKRAIVFKDGLICKDGTPYEILNDIEFLQQNNLQPPRLLDFVHKLRNRGLKVPPVCSVEELAQWINSQGGK
ncbi:MULTISPECIES: energy-coupling factor transporter ATPase [unclassified Mycoplasma]|uniref:energy-coupling factor transporter ATPase n=1 Tax=unclassified Mycoplasma TaxID=2683645 RepID=UPI00211B8C36|nr:MULTISPECIES: energy-coupling factor transporter ATPase [unclassified Mycoplasma]UUM19799.1 energy-coupling factor transporter ATPase [Mycoplasma sp. 1578d]UUM24783.1 energy-coupling factor transporter ATPase [Mycoplasma sp. 3686d]